MSQDTKSALTTIARLADRSFGRRATYDQKSMCHKRIPHKSAWPNLIVMTDYRIQGDASQWISHMPAGSILCLRDYDMAGREAYATHLASAARQHAVRLIVGNDPKLAIRVKAWGAHIPEGVWRTSYGDIARAKAAGLRVTTSAHSLRALHRAHAVAQPHCAKEVSCDAVLASPVFPTRSHPGAPTLGRMQLLEMTRASAVPVYALGGVTPHTIMQLGQLKLAGVAGIRFTDEL